MQLNKIRLGRCGGDVWIEHIHEDCVRFGSWYDTQGTGGTQLVGDQKELSGLHCREFLFEVFI